MSADKPELFSSVKRLIKEQNKRDELEKALPLPPPKFGKWHKKKKQTPRLADCDDAIVGLIGEPNLSEGEMDQ